MDAARATASLCGMISPIVTERLPVLEPVTADTFIAGDKPPAPLAPVHTRRIVD